VGRELLFIVLAMSIFFGVFSAAVFFVMYRRKLKSGSFLPSREESLGNRLRRQKPSTSAQKMVPACLYGFCAVLYTVEAWDSKRGAAFHWVVAAVFWIITIYFANVAWKVFQKQTRLRRLPRRDGFNCPNCREMPQIGDLWGCKECHKAFDTFHTHAVCPHCETWHNMTMCPNCKEMNPMSDWGR
jgi:hypothetical protein